jgi:hypothetical protein
MRPVWSVTSIVFRFDPSIPLLQEFAHKPDGLLTSFLYTGEFSTIRIKDTVSIIDVEMETWHVPTQEENWSGSKCTLSRRRPEIAGRR